MIGDGVFFGIVDNDQGIANVAVVAVALWGACDGVVLVKFFEVVVCCCFNAGEAAAGVDA